MSKPYLECVNCERPFPLDTVNSKCQTCDEPLEFRFDLNAVPQNWFQTQRSDFFALRYAPFYPYLDPQPRASLGEGRTTLLNSVFIAEKIGLRALFFKNETQNPTWTFKDRGTACSVQNALRLGYKRFGTLSSGNMGASVAAYGSRADLDTIIIRKTEIDLIFVADFQQLRIELSIVTPDLNCAGAIYCQGFNFLSGDTLFQDDDGIHACSTAVCSHRCAHVS